MEKTLSKLVKATPLIYGFLVFCGALHLDMVYTKQLIKVFEERIYLKLHKTEEQRGKK
jgi:hypothetical protein